MPQTPDLVMARSDKPLKRDAKRAAHEVSGAQALTGDAVAAAAPRGSEYLAAGLGEAAVGREAPQEGGVCRRRGGGRGG